VMLGGSVEDVKTFLGAQWVFWAVQELNGLWKNVL
jgi:hypothetical protein